MLFKFRKDKIGLNVLYFILAWIIITFLYFPNINLFNIIFVKNGSFSFSAIGRLISSKRAVQSLLNSFVLACTAIVTTNLIGIFTVFVTEYFDIKGSKILKLGYMTPLVYSGVVLVSGYKFVYGSTGIITKLLYNFFPNMNLEWFNGYVAVAFVFTFAKTSNHLIFLSDSLKSIDYQIIEAAQNMGASQWSIIKKVVLPILKPTIFALTVLVFISGMGATSYSMIVGGDTFQTIGPMVLSFSGSPASIDIAALLALILGVATATLLLIMTYYERKNNYASVAKTHVKFVKQKIRNKTLNIVVHILAYLLFVMYMLPMILIIILSFTNTRTIGTGEITLASFTLENYIKVLSQSLSILPFINSAIYSIAASLIVATLALIVARLVHKYRNKLTSFIEYSLLIPWVLPKTLIAIGLIITFDRARFLMFNKVLSGTVWILLVGYIIVKIPFTLKMLKTAFYTMDDSLEEAAKSLGAGPIYTFVKVVLPIVIAPTLAVIALNFNSLLIDYDLTVFLYHPLKTPIGILIQNSIDGGEQATDTRALLLVYSVIIMIVATITLYFVYGKNRKDDK